MKAGPIVTGVQLTEFEYELQDMGTDYNGFNVVYQKGSTVKRRFVVLQITTNQGITGETVTSSVEVATVPIWARYLIGKNALERDRLYSDVKRALRQVARLGVSAMDNALWDIAGKFYDAPLWQLLGGHKRPLPAYASTTHGDDNGGLTTYQDYADFAVECKKLGYPAFKIHGWGGSQVAREVANIAAVRKAVPDMVLMIDPACELNTWADALTVGRACDDANFFWLEDPYKDGGISQFGHRKLRQLIKTPILQTEHVRSLEPHVDFAVNEGTDFVRGDVNYDGVTGVMKLAHACEGLGIDIELHGAGPLQRHVMTSIRNTNYYEMALVHPKAPQGTVADIYEDYKDGLTVIDKNGCVYAPDGPGIGVHLRWDYIKKHTTSSAQYK